METYPNNGEVSQGLASVTSEEIKNTFYSEIDSWCYGLTRFPDTITPKLMHALLREMSGAFLYAVNNHFVFDLIKVAKKLFETCDGVVSEKELAMHIIACLPNPKNLDEKSLQTFKEIIENTKTVYPDVVKRFENRLKNC